MNDLIQYLKKRRSALSVTLTDPGPGETDVRSMVEIASRVPDHGKLAPWRFVLWSPETRADMHARLSDFLASKPEIDDSAKKQQGTDKLLHAPCVIAVISKAAEHPKIPKWEQILSTGAVCQNLLIAANAHGFDAQWLTAWYVYEEDAKPILGLAGEEQIAGIIHIGSSDVPKNERPRPVLDDIFSIRES